MTSCYRRALGSRRRLAPLAAALVLVLSGCGQVHPGTAVSVGSERIGHEEVDDLATALCSVNTVSAELSGQPPPETAARVNREAAVGILIEISLSRQFGEERDAVPDEDLVSQALAQNAQRLAALPASVRPGFRTALADFAEGQSILINIGRESLEASGGSEVPDDQALAEGQRLRSEFVTGFDIEVDPRYGSWDRGALQPGGQSLSVPVSQEAVAGSRSDPAPDFVSGLPASQKCS